MYDIIVVGAGPAGLTAGIYGARAGKSVLVLEAKSYGGQIINTPKIENYPAMPHVSGFDFATDLYNQVLALGVTIKFEKVLDAFDHGEYKLVKGENNEYKTKTLILATGADNRKLGIDKEEELTGHGVSYCASCDGSFFKNKIVAVTGGGNVAIEDANYLSNICSKVYLIHRRDTFRADDADVAELKKKDNVEFILNSNVTKLNGDNVLESIEVTNKITNEVKTIPLSGLFIAVGQVPENENFRDLINIDDRGYIIANESCETNVPGIFVAGDARTKTLRQLVTAEADGAIAATSASRIK